MSEFSRQKMLSLNSVQRFEMIDNGMNPLKEEHVKAYLNGKVIKESQEEKLERARAIIGDDVFNKSIGSSKDIDRDLTDMIGKEYNTNSISNTNNYESANTDPVYLRAQAAKEIENYGSSTGYMSSSKLKTISPKLMSLDNEPKKQNKMNNNKLNEAIETGRNLSTNFHNAYIISLKNPSTANYMSVFKSLKEMLEQERDLKGSQLLVHYQNGINEVTKEMYKKVTQKLHD